MFCLESQPGMLPAQGQRCCRCQNLQHLAQLKEGIRLILTLHFQQGASLARSGSPWQELCSTQQAPYKNAVGSPTPLPRDEPWGCLVS